MRVMMFGTYDVRSHPRVAVLRDGLRAHGHDVVEVNAPLGLDTASRVAMLQQPWRLPLLLLRLLRCWSSLALRSRRGPHPDVVLVGYLGHFDVLLARALFPRTPVVLDHLISAAGTALDRDVRGGLRQRLLQRLDAAATGAADLVVVDTDEHADALPPAVRDRTLVVAVGAPEPWFRARGSESRTPDGPLRVVFFGLFTPLQGAVTIGAALALLADDPVETLLCGTGQDLAATRAAVGDAAGVTWRDWVPAEELPAVVAAADVCLGIVGDTVKALRVVPNKVFQGAAAGCAVVTSDTAPQRRLLGTDAVLVPPGDPLALAQALRRLATDRVELARLRAAAAARADADFTAAAVTAELAGRLPGLARG